jgi:acetyl-CoA carboxylase biotin carboxyl carrier protein
MERLADELLPALIAHFNASGLGELEIRRGDWRVRLRASAAGRPASAGEGTDPGAAAGSGRKSGRTAGGQAPAVIPATASGNGAASSDTGGERPDSPPARGTPERHVAASPGVGYFTARDGLAAGSAVRGGDVLGHVDVLGVAVEVVAPGDGIVARVLAGGGEAVEYGQELVRLEPSSSGVPVRES